MSFLCGEVEVEMKVYQSARAIAEAIFSASGMPIDEIGIECASVGNPDEIIDLSIDDFVEQLEHEESDGYWGFADADTTPPTIHVWARPDVPLDELVGLIAHEIGHVTGSPCEDQEQEEVRADEFAAVAVKSLQLAQIIHSSKQGKH